MNIERPRSGLDEQEYAKLSEYIFLLRNALENPGGVEYKKLVDDLEGVDYLKFFRGRDVPLLTSGAEFFQEVDTIDSILEKVQQQVGGDFDLFEPRTLEAFLHAIPNIMETNKDALIQALHEEPSADSPATFFAFYAMNFGLTRLKDILLNWPGRVGTLHSFACRAVALHFISDLQKWGVVNTSSRAVIARAMPFMSAGFGWNVCNSQISREIADIHRESLEALYALPAISVINDRATEFYEKYRADFTSESAVVASLPRDSQQWWWHHFMYAKHSFIPILSKEKAQDWISREKPSSKEGYF